MFALRPLTYVGMQSCLRGGKDKDFLLYKLFASDILSLLTHRSSSLKVRVKSDLQWDPIIAQLRLYPNFLDFRTLRFSLFLLCYLDICCLGGKAFLGGTSYPDRLLCCYKIQIDCYQMSPITGIDPRTTARQTGVFLSPYPTPPLRTLP